MLSIDDMIELHKMKARAAKNFNARTTVSYTAEEHEQLAEWLEELKAIKGIDLTIPQHFTKQQSEWIKSYCIQRNKEFYNKALDDFADKIISLCDDGEFMNRFNEFTATTILELAEQLKVGVDNGT